MLEPKFFKILLLSFIWLMLIAGCAKNQSISEPVNNIKNQETNSNSLTEEEFIKLRNQLLKSVTEGSLLMSATFGQLLQEPNYANNPDFKKSLEIQEQLENQVDEIANILYENAPEGKIGKIF